MGFEQGMARSSGLEYLFSCGKQGCELMQIWRRGGQGLLILTSTLPPLIPLHPEGFCESPRLLSHFEPFLQSQDFPRITHSSQAGCDFRDVTRTVTSPTLASSNKSFHT